MCQENHHTMNLVKTYPTGAEEWHCPTCGYRFLMQWPPVYKKTILEAGDSNAVHSGGKGGVSVGSVEISEDQNQAEKPDLGLQPWIEWAKKIDLDSQLNQEP